MRLSDENLRGRTVIGADGQAIGEVAALFLDSEAWGIAAIYAVQSVIQPHETRDYLIRMLDVHRQRLSNGVGQHLMRAWPTSF